MTGILRDELKFQGLVISDSMAMSAVADNYPDREEAWTHAVLAGVDMILDTSSDDIYTHYRKFVGVVQRNPELRARVDQACLNIVAHKIQYGVITAPGVPLPAPLVFKRRDAERAAAQVAKSALAVREGTLRKFASVVQAIQESMILSLLYNARVTPCMDT